MPKCPECDQFPPVSHPTSVDAESYAEHRAELWVDSYDGIAEAMPRSEGPNGATGLRLNIDGSAYSTDNHYQHRGYHESADGMEVVDVDDNVVDVWFHNVKTTITAMRCQECGCIWEDTLGVLEPPTQQ